MNGMDENKFWIIIWVIVAVALISLLIIAVSYNSHKNTLIAESGDPLATACALSDSDAKPCMAYLGSLK